MAKKSKKEEVVKELSHVDKKIAKYYDLLSKAIEERLYIRITCSFPDKTFDEAKPIKIIFSDNNWYIGIAYNNEKNKETFRLCRMAFITDVKLLKDFPYSSKNSFQTKGMDRYLHFLDNDFQNAMTVFDKPKKTARLKAINFISRYFEKDMKKFFTSQEFVDKLEDGSVIFEVDYTLSLEILPFIQKWLPDLIIMEPKELRDEYMDKLNKTLQNQKEIE